MMRIKWIQGMMMMIIIIIIIMITWITHHWQNIRQERRQLQPTKTKTWSNDDTSEGRSIVMISFSIWKKLCPWIQLTWKSSTTKLHLRSDKQAEHRVRVVKGQKGLVLNLQHWKTASKNNNNNFSQQKQ